MKKAFIESVTKLFGVQTVELNKLPLSEVLEGRDLETEVQELDINTLKALFRWSGKELRNRI